MGLNTKPINDDAEFENEAVDPGFSTEDSEKSDFKDENFVENLKELDNLSKNRGEDAMNLDNDRENGAFNPKNI